MLGLIRNELIKYRKKKKFIIIILAVIALTALVMYSYNRSVKNFNKYNGVDFRISQNKQQIEDMKKDKENIQLPKDVRESIPNDINNLQKEIEMLQKQKKSGQKDYKEILKEDMQKRKQEKEQVKKQINKEQNKMALESVNTDINIDKYLIENKIEPIADRYNGMIKKKITAFGYLKEMFGMFGVIFLAIIIAVYVGDCVSGEYTPPTMKVLLTKPISRGKILFSKFVASIISISSIMISIELLGFLLIGMVFKFGNPLYPIAVGTKYEFGKIINESGIKNILPIENSTYIIPQWKYWIGMILLQLLFIIACVAVFFLLSTVLKSSMASSSLSVVVVIGLFIISNMRPFRKISAFLFTSYGNPTMVSGGGSLLVRQFNSPFINIQFMIGLMVVYTVVCYLIAHFIFKKKDILI